MVAFKGNLNSASLQRNYKTIQSYQARLLKFWKPPTYDRRTLVRANILLGGNQRILSTDFDAILLPDWREGLEAINVVFGLHREGHCFTVDPYNWASFHEPQITGGLVHFLTNYSSGGGAERALAFVKAAFQCAGRSIDFLDDQQLSNFEAEAELIVRKSNRIDMVVKIEIDAENCAKVVIEAKFGADLSERQLEIYIDDILKGGSEKNENCVFLVISPSISKLNLDIRNKNKYWTFQTWWNFMMLVEKYLLPQDDCEEYRKFRRTIWKKAYDI